MSGVRVEHSKASGNAEGGIKGDNVGGRPSGAKVGSSHERVSFRDKVVGNKRADNPASELALEGVRLGTVIGKQGDPEPPRITFTKETKEVFSMPYKDAVVIKVLDRNLSYMALTNKLRSVWRLRGSYDLLDLLCDICDCYGHIDIDCHKKKDQPSMNEEGGNSNSKPNAPPLVSSVGKENGNQPPANGLAQPSNFVFGKSHIGVKKGECVDTGEIPVHGIKR
ncbi:hypothetical protein PIB30_051553 [Stylosanthes scabra]|uniref:DUF4283 domain-containing protein n=1 Tax=Stylosanthes scabra TaxID=79078 RepID=A0ABU6YIK5_9FABA|nr:hypothetical protein [Stylosanthes scabra]